MIKKTLVIILNWNKPKETLECINSITNANGSFDILIIDNGSNNDNRALLIELIKNEYNANILNLSNPEQAQKNSSEEKNIYIILSGSNTGYARGNNIGVILSLELGYRYSLISNNDVIVTDKNVIIELENCIDQDQKIAWVAPKILNISGKTEGPFQKTEISELFFKKGILLPLWFLFKRKKEVSEFKIHTNQYETGDATPYIFGGSFGLFRNTALKDVGFFDENTFLYSEEQIISERLNKKNYLKKYVPDSQIIHNHKYDKDGLNYKLELYFLRSRIYYYTKYRGYNKFFVLLGALSRIFWLLFYKPIIILLKNI